MYDRHPARLAGSGDELPGSVEGYAEREWVLDALKTAFIHGRLDKDEFEQRVGHVLAAYAEVDALIADIPSRLPAVRPPRADLILGSVTGVIVTLVLAGFLTLLSLIIDIAQLAGGLTGESS